MAQQTIRLYARKWAFTAQSDPVRVQDLTGKTGVNLYKEQNRLYVKKLYFILETIFILMKQNTQILV